MIPAAKKTYCGVFACENRECIYHLSRIERADIPHDYRNLRGTDLCSKNKTIQKNQKPMCKKCKNAIPVGDPIRCTFVCREIAEGKVKIVIEDYGPGADYMGCGGKRYEANL